MRQEGAAAAGRRQVALLVAEFAALDLELAAITDGVARGEAGLLDEDELDHLATDIPDMRTRLGIRQGPPPAFSPPPSSFLPPSPPQAASPRVRCVQYP